MFSDGSTQILLVAIGIVVALVIPGAIIFSRRRRHEAITAPQSQDLSQSPESFAVSSLFEATMGSMREGLLVVDKDMRVIASNPAAHKLFNSSMPRLNSQRLTELTRNPAIYSAFLDGLKGVERSGVKVQTHGDRKSTPSNAAV